MKILVTEDEKKISKFIKKGLEEAGHVVDCAYDGNTSLSLCETFDYDLLIMDVMLPDLDGVKVVQTLRQRGIDFPAIFLSALSETKDKIKGLDSGGDDYLVKPFDFEELLARIRSITRRGGKALSERYLKAGDLEIDLLSRAVTRSGKEIDLTNKEYILLKYLVSNKNRPVTRTKLLQVGWDYNFDPESNVVDVYINMLRKKIDKEFEKKLIFTEVGVGYIIKE